MATVTRSSRSNLTIKTNEPEYLRCDTHCEGVLKHLRGREDLYDVVLVVGDSGKRISAHRLILTTYSDYFSALLSGPMRESQEREITVSDVVGDALEKLVNFCYSGSLELRGDTIGALLTTANHLHLKEVVEGCCEFLQRHLQPSNGLAVCLFAKQMNLEALLYNAKKFIFKHFAEISNHPEFFLLTGNELCEFLANDDLDVPSEEFVFRILMKWIEYEPENRRHHFTELLALVRLPLLSPTFLVEEVEPLCNTVESHQLFVNALKSHLLFTCNSTQPRNYQSRSVANQLLAVYLRQNIYKRKYEIQIAGYHLGTNEWTICKIPIHSRISAVALMDDKLIVVGGSLNGSALNTVTSFNLRTLASTQMAPLQTRRCGHSVAILNGLIYAIGGHDGRQALNSVERWDPESGIWSSVVPMKNARFDLGVAVLNGHLYVSGGYNSMHAYDASVECYDPVQNTWRSTAPMKVGRVSHCLAAHKGYLFAIGGCVEEDEDEEYDDEENTGEECEDEEYEDEEIPIERYDPRTNTWTTIPSTPAIYGCTRCASSGPDLFIINESNSYMISSEGSCDNLQLQILAKPHPEPMQNVDLACVELFPCEFSSLEKLHRA